MYNSVDIAVGTRILNFCREMGVTVRIGSAYQPKGVAVAQPWCVASAKGHLSM